MNIQVGDYVWCQDIEEYGFVEQVERASYPDITDFVRVRIEFSGAYRYYAAHELVNANTDTSPMCEPASDKTVSGEVRQTSDSGAQKGSKLARYDMIPADALELLAEHYGKGAEKYPPFDSGDGLGILDNYRRGYHWSLSFAAMQRHSWQFWNGEDIDPETGSPHLIAAAWHCLTMVHWMNNPELAQKYDDRPRM